MRTMEEKPVMTLAWMPPAMIMRGMLAVTTSVIFQPLEKAIKYATANVTRFCTSSPTYAHTEAPISPQCACLPCHCPICEVLSTLYNNSRVLSQPSKLVGYADIEVLKGL